jgi:hypothetical protein
LLYPNGIQPDQFDDALLLARIWDKMSRVATDRNALGESPYMDLAGYGIRGVNLHQHPTEPFRGILSTWEGSANGQNVSGSSKAEQPDFAAQNISAKTTTNESATSAPVPSQQPANSSAALADATVRIVEAPANASVVAQQNNLAHTYECWLYRNNVLKCIACEKSVMGRLDKFQIVVRTGLGSIGLSACSGLCADFCHTKLNAGTVDGARPA